MDHCVGNVGDASNLILIRFFRFPPAKTWSLASINIQFLFQTARMTCVRAGGCHYHHHPHHHHYHHPPARASVTPAGPCSGRTDKCAWTASMVSSAQDDAWWHLSHDFDIFLRMRDGRLCHGQQLGEDPLRVPPIGGPARLPQVRTYSQSEKVFDVGNWDLSFSLWWNNFVILTKLRH